jgi:hypothetical protein
MLHGTEQFTGCLGLDTRKVASPFSFLAVYNSWTIERSRKFIIIIIIIIIIVIVLDLRTLEDWRCLRTLENWRHLRTLEDWRHLRTLEDW